MNDLREVPRRMEGPSAEESLCGVQKGKSAESLSTLGLATTK